MQIAEDQMCARDEQCLRMRRVDREFGMEVLTTAEMERADRLTITAGTPGFALMLSAGQAVAEAAMDLVEEGPILVVAGSGNNGGDGFVAAAELAARGREVSVILLCERDSLQGDAASAARGWKYPVLPFNPQAIGHPALIVDALFGAGLNRPVQGEPHDMIEADQRQRRAGAQCRPAERHQRHHRGAVMGIGHQRHRDGDLLPAQAGAFAAAGPDALRPGACRRYRHRRRRPCGNPAADVRKRSAAGAMSFPVPRIDGHKYARGHAVIVSGDIAATGAARLAARGCLRAGAGLVDAGFAPGRAGRQRGGADRRDGSTPSIRVVEFAELLTDKRLNALVIGPGAGVGDRTRDFVLTALSAQRSLVLDADALTSFAGSPRPPV